MLLLGGHFKFVLRVCILAACLLFPIDAIKMPPLPHSSVKKPPPDAIRRQGASPYNRAGDPFHLGPLHIIPTPKKLFVPKAHPKYIVHIVYSPKTQFVGNLDLMRAVGGQFLSYTAGDMIDSDKIFHTNAKTCTEVNEGPRLETVVHLDGAWGREWGADPKTIQHMLIETLMGGLLRVVEWSVVPIYSDCLGAEHWQAMRGPHHYNAACGGQPFGNPCPCPVGNAVCDKVSYSIEVPVNLQVVLYNENEFEFADHLSLSFEVKDLHKGHMSFCGIPSTVVMIIMGLFGAPWSMWTNAIWLYCTIHMPRAAYHGKNDKAIPGWPPKSNKRKRDFVRHPDATESITYEIEFPEGYSNSTGSGMLDLFNANKD